MNWLPQNIRYLRKKSGQNQAELALNFGKKQNTVGNWENGVSEPSIKELVVLSQVFMVKMEDLVNRNLEHGISPADPGEQATLIPENSQKAADLPLTVQDKETDGFWLTLRELRRIDEKLDELIRNLSRGRGNSSL